ncbi:MAG: hypothetical protein R3A52_32715 [Polyangiales bacterium]
MLGRVALVALAVTALPGVADAVAYGSAPVEIELMPGVRVHRAPTLCLATRLAGPDCFTWTAQGMTLPPPTLSLRVNTFAGAGERIVAGLEGSVVYSDDRGATWSRAEIDGPQAVRAMAFDVDGRFGAAVGTNGSLWTSDDGGARWRLRRDGGGRVLVDVAVLGSLVVWSDDHGGVRISTDGGSTLRTLAERAREEMPVMVRFDGAVWIRLEGTRWFRVRGDGVPERVERSPWG